VTLPTGQVHDAMIIDLLETRVLEFVYMPAEFSESKAAEWANVNILGRSEPIVSYSHSGPRVFNLNLWFIVHGERSYAQEILEPIRLIRSWVYPYYSTQERGQPNTRLSTPPTLLFVVGSWLRQRCIAQRYNITYRAPWGRDDVNLSSAATVENVTDAFGNVIGQQSVPATIVARGDSMVPFVVEVNLQLQEVNENIPQRSPFDTFQVRHGDDLINLAEFLRERPGT